MRTRRDTAVHVEPVGDIWMVCQGPERVPVATYTDAQEAAHAGRALARRLGVDLVLRLGASVPDRRAAGTPPAT